MSSSENSAGGGFAPFLTRDDEMGLASAKTVQSRHWIPDMLEAHRHSAARRSLLAR